MTDADDQTPTFALYRGTSSELASPVVATAAAVVDALPGADDSHGFVLVVRRDMSDAGLVDRLRRLADELERGGGTGDPANPQARTQWSPSRATVAPVDRIGFGS